ncbi:MAG: YkgJ family cysteine cluster protein [Bacteroidetes bacterium]|nr:MAG: YkgJ family cysteine cluster protein [Bacteroidota bacterium]
MTLGNKVRAVRALYRQLDRDLARFQAQTGLSCLPACGQCCTHPQVEASVLEFLPLAYELMRQGEAGRQLQLLESEDNPLCFLFRPLRPEGEAGFCGDYPHRGLICRLFGFSVMRDKHGQRQLYTCRRIKGETPETYAQAVAFLKAGRPVPGVSAYYRRLTNIDPELAGRFLPIRQAIREALRFVLHYYSYRRPPRRRAA